MDKLFTKIHDVYIRKNSDYGDSFTQSLFKWGDVAYFVRAEDKLNRYKSLRNKGSKRFVYDETVQDTLEDLLNYTIMYIMYYHEELSYYYTYRSEDNPSMHKIVSRKIYREPKVYRDMFEEFNKLTDMFKGKNKALDKIEQAIAFATAVRDEIYRLEYLQSQTLVSRLKKVKEHNLKMIHLNERYEQSETISHEEAKELLELENWFKKLIEDLDELNDVQIGVLVDKVVLDYPNDFITHRYKITDRYIRKLVQENS